MTDDRSTSPSADDGGKIWRPSRKPDRSPYRREEMSHARIVERTDPLGPIRALRGLLRSPVAKAIVAVCLFIVGAILFDATINGGSWTEKQSKPRPATTRKVRPAISLHQPPTAIDLVQPVRQA